MVIYRAKKIDSNEWIEGHLVHDDSIGKYAILTNFSLSVVYGIGVPFIIDPKTIAIHFPSMLDKNGKKIFASLGEDGIGGDRVSGMCRDCNGDELQGLHAPVPFEGIVRFYSETVMGVVIETTDRIVVGTKDWVTPIVLERGSALRWSDCRHSIEVIESTKEEGEAR